jgi:hypothetical protein
LDAEELSQDWKKGSPENRRQRQTIPLRQMPKTKSEACKNACSVVLPELPQRERYARQRGLTTAK